MAAIDEWHEALEESKESKLIHFSKRVSHFIPPLFRSISLVIASIALVNYLPNLVNNKTDLVSMSTLGIYSFLFLFFTYKITGAIGYFVEQSIDSANEISYIKATKGDEKLIADSCIENKLAYIKAIAGTAITCLLNFASKYSASHLGN